MNDKAAPLIERGGFFVVPHTILKTRRAIPARRRDLPNGSQIGFMAVNRPNGLPVMSIILPSRLLKFAVTFAVKLTAKNYKKS